MEPLLLVAVMDMVIMAHLMTQMEIIMVIQIEVGVEAVLEHTRRAELQVVAQAVQVWLLSEL